MIQLNLLPDIKLEYAKAQRARRLVTVIAFFATSGAIGLLVFLLGINAIQKSHINKVSESVASDAKKLKGQQGISKVLTVQNQLKSLTALHAGKPQASHLFEYLNEITPLEISISSLNTDFVAYSMTITGTADKLSNVNRYIDTLKFTTFTSDTNKADTKAFSSVVLTSFGLTSGGQGVKPATYTIKLNYDKSIFDISQKVSLTVPTRTTTRASINDPTDLFQAAPTVPVTRGVN